MNNNYTFTNANRNQNSLEVELTHMLCLSGEGEILDELNFAEWAKVEEPEWESLHKKGTRHPSTRQERRKKTAHAKARKTETIRARESRKLPYSHMLGKGKRHDHVWIDERSIVESRTEEKLTSELRDFVLCEESEWEWYEKEQKDALWEYLSCRSEIEDWEKFLSRFHEREKNNYIKAALEAAATKIKLEAEEKFRSQWWI